MVMKISDICEVIWQQELTDAERENNSKGILLRRMNALLIMNKDLTECAIGKIETKQGAEHGIHGELRESDDGKRYWMPLYTDQGYQYVLNLFRDHKSAVIDLPPNHPYRYTRTLRRSLKAQYHDLYKVYLMEGPDSYWVFDEDALLLGSEFHFLPRETPRGHNLQYKKEYHNAITGKLRLLQIPYCVVHPATEDAFVPEHQPLLLTIGYGMIFRTRDQYNEVHSFIILRDEDAVRVVVIDRPDGTQEITTEPILVINGYTRLSPETEMAVAMDGAKIGEYRLCNGIRYRVEEIKPFNMERIL